MDLEAATSHARKRVPRNPQLPQDRAYWVYGVAVNCVSALYGLRRAASWSGVRVVHNLPDTSC
jgi:hypothetical protein